MSQFFEYAYNRLHSIESAHVLSRLVQIYYGRKKDSIDNIIPCLEVIGTQNKIMMRCKKYCHESLPKFPGEGDDLAKFWDMLYYEMNDTKFTIIKMKGVYNKAYEEQAIWTFRFLCIHEVEYKASVVPYYINTLKRSMASGADLSTVKAIEDLSDDDILRAIKLADAAKTALETFAPDIAREIERVSEEGGKDMSLRKCACCNQTESALGDFKHCSVCKQVAYCGRQCQLAHWKQHKKVCHQRQK